MKIVYVFDSLSRTGGTERILISKMNYLADIQGHEVFILTWNQSVQRYPFALSTKVKHIDIDVSFDNEKHSLIRRIAFKIKTLMTLRQRMQKAIDDIHPDIIIATTYQKPGLTCTIKTKAIKIVESHCPRSLILGVDSSIFAKNWNISIAYHRLSVLRSIHMAERHCDCLVSLTSGDYGEWRRASMKRIIPNMINTDHFYQSDCTHKRVICAGRLNEQKGFDLMVKAWKNVAARHKDWELAIFGDGELKEVLVQQVQIYNLSDSVKIMPFTDNIYKEYTQSSVFVLSSRYEGFGLVLAEAMSCGIPCISFDCHYGPSDIIKDGKDGLLVTNGDIAALANAICWMIEHDDERKAMGRRAKQNVDRYSPKVIMAQWNDLFHKLYNKQQERRQP